MKNSERMQKLRELEGFLVDNFNEKNADSVRNNLDFIRFLMGELMDKCPDDEE